MPIDILMPALSPTMEEGKLAKWLKAEGDSVASGDVIAEIETDKATMEVEAVDEGVIGKIMIAEGTDAVKVNEVIAVLLEEGEDASAMSASGAPSQATTASEETPAPAPSVPAAPSAPVESVTVADPDIPAGTEMVSTTVREALNAAMSEEMRADEDV
ncbi:MAG: biotin/lipoyl-containing protein, partial [Devosiaceae bacterium]